MRTFTIIFLLLISCIYSGFSQKCESQSVINPFNCESYIPFGWVSDNNQLYLYGNASIDVLTPPGLFFVKLNREEFSYDLLGIKNQFFQKPICFSNPIAEYKENFLTLTMNMAHKFKSNSDLGTFFVDDYNPFVVKLDTNGSIVSQSTDSVSIRKKTIDGTVPSLCMNDNNEIIQAFHYVDLKDSMIKVIIGRYDSTAKFINEYEPLKFPIDSIKKLGLHSIIYIPYNMLYKDGNYYIFGEKRTWITTYKFKIEMFYCALNPDFSVKFFKEIVLSEPNYGTIAKGSNILFSGNNMMFVAQYSPSNKLFIIDKTNGEIIYENMSDIYPQGKYFESSDGNYIVCGSTTPTENYDAMKNSSNGKLIKIDKNFNPLWTFPPMYPDKYNDSFGYIMEIEPNVYTILGKIDKKVSLTIISDKESDVSEDNFGNCTFIKKGNFVYFKSSAEIIPKIVFIHDILGRKISEMIPNPSNGEIEISLNNLPAGSYFVSVITDGHQFSKKYIVE
jgi:hypothetical protein